MWRDVCFVGGKVHVHKDTRNVLMRRGEQWIIPYEHERVRKEVEGVQVCNSRLYVTVDDSYTHGECLWYNDKDGDESKFPPCKQ